MFKKILFISVCLFISLNVRYSIAEVELRKEYYEGGLYSEIPYKNGKKDGIAKFYYKTGELYSESQFKNGKAVGVKKTYYKTGELYSVIQFKKGKKNGIEKHYDKSGKLLWEKLWEDGEPKSMRKYYKSGNLKEEGFYKDGEYTIIRKITRLKWSNGNLRSETYYKHDKKEGVEKTYSPDGNLFSEMPFKDGKKEGVMKLYDKGGNVTAEVIYKDDGVVDTRLSEVYLDKAKEIAERCIESLKEKKYKQVPQSTQLGEEFQVILSTMQEILEMYSGVLGEIVGYKYKSLEIIELRYFSPMCVLYFALLYETQFANDSADISVVINDTAEGIRIANFNIIPHSDKYRQLLRKEIDNLIKEK